MTRLRTITAVAALAGALAGALVMPSAVSARGGWAVTTLDSTPEVEAGVPEQIGFSIRQLGVSPVDVDDVSVVVVDGSGQEHRFHAVPDGVPGHYVVTVEIAVPGDMTWAVDQGWFGRQELGSLTVSQATAAPESATHRAGEPIRWALPLLAGLLGLLAVGDLLTRRARTRPSPA